MIWHRSLKIAVILFGVLFLITGVIYPLAVTGVAELAFPYQAHGSLVRNGIGSVMGSELIGMQFSGPLYFEGRPSATAGTPYNAARSGGSNLGPSNPLLKSTVQSSIQHLESHGMRGPWPGDLVTSSGSGLDPHISLDAALQQVPIVAHARGMDEEVVRALVNKHVVPDPFSPGYDYVNVFSLNRALDGRDVP